MHQRRFSGFDPPRRRGGASTLVHPQDWTSGRNAAPLVRPQDLTIQSRNMAPLMRPQDWETQSHKTATLMRPQDWGTQSHKIALLIRPQDLNRPGRGVSPGGGAYTLIRPQDWNRPRHGVSPLNRSGALAPGQGTIPLIRPEDLTLPRGTSPLNRPDKLNHGKCTLIRPQDWDRSERDVSPLNRQVNLLSRSQVASTISCSKNAVSCTRGVSPLNRPARQNHSVRVPVYGPHIQHSLIRPQELSLPGSSNPRRESSRNLGTIKRRLPLPTETLPRGIDCNTWAQDYEKDNRLSPSKPKKLKRVQFSPSTLDNSEKRQKVPLKRWRYKNRRRMASASNIPVCPDPDSKASKDMSAMSTETLSQNLPQTEDSSISTVEPKTTMQPVDISLPDSSSDSESSCSASSSTTSFAFSSDSDIESEDEPARPQPGDGASGQSGSQTDAKKITAPEDDTRVVVNKSDMTLTKNRDHVNPTAVCSQSPSLVTSLGTFEADIIFSQFDLLTKATPVLNGESSIHSDISRKNSLLHGTNVLGAAVTPHHNTESMIFDIRHKQQPRALVQWWDEDKLDTEQEVVLPSRVRPIFPYNGVDINEFLSPIMDRLGLNDMQIVHVGGGDDLHAPVVKARKRGFEREVMETDDVRRHLDTSVAVKRKKLELLDTARKTQKEMRSILENIKVKVAARTQRMQLWVRRRRQQLRRWSKSSSVSSSNRLQLVKKETGYGESRKKSKYFWTKK